MGRYINWDDVIDRYPVLDTVGGADELSSSYIVYAEAIIDGALYSHFAVPFSDNNMIIRNLAIDYCYWRAGRFKIEDAAAVKSDFWGTISMLKNRQMVMIDEAGTIIEASETRAGIYSSTQSYHSVFGPDDPIEWATSQQELDDTRGERS